MFSFLPLSSQIFRRKKKLKVQNKIYKYTDLGSYYVIKTDKLIVRTHHQVENGT